MTTSDFHQKNDHIPPVEDVQVLKDEPSLFE